MRQQKERKERQTEKNSFDIKFSAPFIANIAR